MPNIIINWPEDLPMFGLGWSVGLANNLHRSSPERGPAKVRMLTSSNPNSYSGSIVYNEKNFIKFLDFYKDDLKFGLHKFQFHDFFDDEKKFARITKLEMKQIITSEYLINMTIEVMPW